MAPAQRTDRSPDSLFGPNCAIGLPLPARSPMLIDTIVGSAAAALAGSRLAGTRPGCFLSPAAVVEYECVAITARLVFALGTASKTLKWRRVRNRRCDQMFPRICRRCRRAPITKLPLPRAGRDGWLERGFRDASCFTKRSEVRAKEVWQAADHSPPQGSCDPVGQSSATNGGP